MTIESGFAHPVVVRCGTNGFYRAMLVPAALAGLLAVGLAPAAATWKGVLLLVWLALVARSFRVTAPTQAKPLLTIDPDGRCAWRDQDSRLLEGQLGRAHWTTRWLSQLEIEHIDGKERRLVMASNNQPDDYRRLLVRLRLGQ